MFIIKHNILYNIQYTIKLIIFKELILLFQIHNSRYDF